MLPSHDTRNKLFYRSDIAQKKDIAKIIIDRRQGSSINSPPLINIRNSNVSFWSISYLCAIYWMRSEGNSHNRTNFQVFVFIKFSSSHLSIFVLFPFCISFAISPRTLAKSVSCLPFSFLCFSFGSSSLSFMSWTFVNYYVFIAIQFDSVIYGFITFSFILFLRFNWQIQTILSFYIIFFISLSLANTIFLACIHFHCLNVKMLRLSFFVLLVWLVWNCVFINNF